MKAKIDELLEGDIIERVEGPTTWASPVVVAPKLSGEIRLCVDMCRTNEAIIRERLPIPTVDEVLEELNGSTVFSKLDLRHGFHQVELHTDSRDITTLVTHDGLFRYKRSFGVNAAPEKYQHIISQVITDIEGVVNIADDLIVHRKTVVEHDQSLHKLLARLEEKNLKYGGQESIKKQRRSAESVLDAKWYQSMSHLRPLSPQDCLREPGMRLQLICLDPYLLESTYLWWWIISQDGWK